MSENLVRPVHNFSASVTDVQNENTEKDYKTDEKSLMQEIKTMLDDYFICSISGEENRTVISLENGQRFSLQVKEIS